jgi:hypothetical protein
MGAGTCWTQEHNMPLQTHTRLQETACPSCRDTPVKAIRTTIGWTRSSMPLVPFMVPTAIQHSAKMHKMISRWPDPRLEAGLSSSTTLSLLTLPYQTSAQLAMYTSLCPTKKHSQMVSLLAGRSLTRPKPPQPAEICHYSSASFSSCRFSSTVLSCYLAATVAQIAFTTAGELYTAQI